jgi:hypothetical protein
MSFDTVSETRKEFEAFVDRQVPSNPKVQPKFTVVVSQDYFDRYEGWLTRNNKWTDVGTPAENLLWQGHIIVRGNI